MSKTWKDKGKRDKFEKRKIFKKSGNNDKMNVNKKGYKYDYKGEEEST